VPVIKPARAAPAIAVFTDFVMSFSYVFFVILICYCHNPPVEDGFSNVLQNRVHPL